MQLAPGVHRIESLFGARTNAVYLLVGSRRSLLVDTTTSDSADDILDACAAAGAPHPSWVVTTHADWDHAAGNGIIRLRSPNSLLSCHEQDRAMIEDVALMISDRYGEFSHDHGFDETDESKDTIRAGTTPAAMDISLTGGEVFNLGDDWRITVVHTPGHSHGSISVFDPRSSALIIGDAVLGSAVPLASGTAAFPPTYRYIDDYLATIDAIRTLAPDLLLTSHYPVYSGSEVTDFLDESSRFTRRVEAAMRGAFQGSNEPIGMLELANSVSADLGDWPREAAAALLSPMAGHLERLISVGFVAPSRQANDTITRYHWVGSL